MLTALALLLSSQIAVEHPPDLTALRAAIAEARAKRPDQRALLALGRGPIDENLAADLQKYDWLEVGSWSYPEKKLSLHYDDEGALQHDWLRYLADGSELRFSLVMNQLDASRSQVVHTNFTLPPPTSLALKKVGKALYVELTAFGEKELHRVVSYQRGVLVLDLSYDGKPQSKTVKFRDVRVAMPRLFESSGK